MDQDKKELLQKHMGDKIVQSFLIQEGLRKYLVANPIDWETPDFNPHLHIESVCQEIADQVINENVACTKEDVMLLWLTSAVYGGQFLPNNKP